MTTVTAPSVARDTARRFGRPRWLSARDGAVRRTAFRAALAAFVVLILASYAVPLWFQLHGDRLLVVTSGSMAPEIQAGDAVVVRQVTQASQLRVGQVVTFYPTGSSQLLTHRIVDLVGVVRRDEHDQPYLDASGAPEVEPFIKTKGDANEVTDPNLTPATQVRGIVREVHAGWGYPLGFAHSPLGRALLFVPPLLMLAGAEVLSRMPATWRTKGWLWGRRPTTPAGDDVPAEEPDDAPALV